MQKIRLPLLLSTLYVLVYATTPYWTPECITATMYFLSPLVVLYLVWVVLKKGEPSQFTFEEAFYEDFRGK
ncbi:hypothetical protein [Raineya orbicola]|uniref:Uncharacterized protein n=1 Tax=Raineya orbicola TaxID=2016530 RepID=A0A2N3IAA1_9BACT|nr:hypothetical protein [Raineya orbicola]PKQ67219.1 hypothetical protein Rain11_2146 [Raineya orbicola]